MRTPFNQPTSLISHALNPQKRHKDTPVQSCTRKGGCVSKQMRIVPRNRKNACLKSESGEAKTRTWEERRRPKNESTSCWIRNQEPRPKIPNLKNIECREKQENGLGRIVAVKVRKGADFIYIPRQILLTHDIVILDDDFSSSHHIPNPNSNHHKDQSQHVRMSDTNGWVSTNKEC